MHQHINSAEIKVCFPDVGCLVIGQLEDELQTFCFKNGFDLRTQRGKGFLSKPLFAIIKCPEVRAIHVIKLMEKAGAWTYKEQSYDKTN